MKVPNFITKMKIEKKKVSPRDEMLLKEFEEGRVLQVGNGKDNKKLFKKQ